MKYNCSESSKSGIYLPSPKKVALKEEKKARKKGRKKKKKPPASSVYRTPPPTSRPGGLGMDFSVPPKVIFNKMRNFALNSRAATTR